MQVKCIISGIFLLILCWPLLGQSPEPKVKFSVELPLQISVIPAVNQSFTYGTKTLFLPKFNNYRNPVYGVNVGMYYVLSSGFQAGMVLGINGSFYQNHLYYTDEYLNMLMIPIMGRMIYQKPLKNSISFISDLSAGYNFYKNVSGNTANGFDFEEKGGLKTALACGVGYQLNGRKLTLEVGYDLTGYHNKARVNQLANLSNPDTDILSYKTWYQTLLFKLGVFF